MIYKSRYVLDTDPNTRDGLALGIRRKIERLPNAAGNERIVDVDTERVRLRYLWFSEDKAEAWDFITNFLPSLAGQRNAIWVPSFTRDFVIDRTTFNYYDDGVSDMMALGVHRWYFYAQWMENNGTLGKWANEWYTYTPLANNRVALGMIFSPVPVFEAEMNGSLKFSRMYLMRLEDDAVSVEWHGAAVQATLDFLEVPRVEYPTSAPYAPS